MALLNLYAIDEVYIKVDCSDSISLELRDYFTFFAPNYQFHPLYKKRYWNGKIHLFNSRQRKIYRGLIPYIQDFAKERGYSLQINNDLDLTNEISLFELDKWTERLKLPFRPRDYQYKYTVHVLRNQRALILSPTGSGKSLIIYLLTRFLKASGLRGLLIVPTVQLVHQMVSDFKDYGWADAETYISKVYEGQDKDVDKSLIVSTWQSIYKLDKDYFSKFDYVFCDEAHLASAACLKAILEKCVNAKFRVGLTGTLDGTETHQLVLEGLFGPVMQEVTTKQLMDRGDLSNFRIKCINLKYEEELPKMTYHEEMEYLIFNEKRNKFIVNLALSLKKNTLVMFRYVEKHGKILYNLIKEAAGDRSVYFIAGEVDAEIREEIRKIVETENDAIIVASLGTFSTGVNIKNLHNIIGAMPTKGRIKLFQTIGRSLRLHDSKEIATLFDISDIFCYNNFSSQHFEARVKMYYEEKFPIKFYKVRLT